MNYDKSIPEMSPDFCDRVVARSREIKQRRPLTFEYVRGRLDAMLPVRVNWAVAVVAVVFVAGIFIGVETYTPSFSDTIVSEVMEI